MVSQVFTHREKHSPTWRSGAPRAITASGGREWAGVGKYGLTPQLDSTAPTPRGGRPGGGQYRVCAQESHCGSLRAFSKMSINFQMRRSIWEALPLCPPARLGLRGATVV